MSRWIFIFAILTMIFILITIRSLKEKKSMIKTNRSLEDTTNRNRKDIQYKRYNMEKLEVSLKNTNNTIEYINKLSQEPMYYHQRYIKVYQRELSYKDDFDRDCSQIVYAVFYEDNLTYKMEYLNRKDQDFDINRDVTSFKLECILFIDTKYLEPSTNGFITPESKSLGIQELNLHKHEGKGAGSFYLQCLSKELLRYPQIKYIRGSLSPKDIKYKDGLIHFYKKNGFEDIVPMTKTSFGHVSKTIK